ARNPRMPEPDFVKRGGLVPAIAQDATSGEILMVAYMNPEAWRHTLTTGRATYWSTSRNALWVKGDTSGRVQHVREILVDSVDDAGLRCLLVRAQEIARYVENGTLDAGITGRDWVLEHGADVHIATELVYSKTSLRPTRWVLVVGRDSTVQKPEDLRGGRVAT